MNILLELVEDEDKDLKLYVPEEKSLKDISELVEKIKGLDIKVVRTERISYEQTKLIWCLCQEYGELDGYTSGEMREVLENEFCIEKDLEYFSISPNKKTACSSKVATEFIQFIIEHSIKHGFDIRIPEGQGEKRRLRSAREVVPEIKRYIIACLRVKKCVVCGRVEGVDLHHSPALGVPYEQDDGRKTGFMSLCRECHTKAHSIGLKEFESKYHLEPVWLSDGLIRELKKIYTNHFQAF